MPKKSSQMNQKLISKATLKMMDQAMKNFSKGIVGKAKMENSCPSCYGTGKAFGNTSPGNLHPCEDCDGSGKEN
jgi:DnaJ-class molecular chaperone